MPLSSFVFGNFFVEFSARICCRSLPRFRSFVRVASDRRVRYLLRCSCVLPLSISSPMLAFVVGCAVSPFVRYYACSCVSSLAVVFRGSHLYIVTSRAEDNLVHVRCCVTFFRVSLPLRCGSFRGIVVRLLSSRVGVCVRNVPLLLYRSVLVLLRSFGCVDTLVPRYAARLFRVSLIGFRIVFLSGRRCRVPYG